ncbi:patatin-like phospholipase family protein [Photobacterium sanguinicancri]|uniref:Patatin-like phospholipase family protein n=1 Tax=Photobacterium sanguinicancri TaxID=875932 RepID=A0AAW7Y672_9GAMM|nr:patatin-like phospholipase family protein [Photobacterium sanguinicancri]MDO6542125.1 patatin-like phospholipase family protein [Photobacterium sanguinicancri]
MTNNQRAKRCAPFKPSYRSAKRWFLATSFAVGLSGCGTTNYYDALTTKDIVPPSEVQQSDSIVGTSYDKAQRPRLAIAFGGGAARGMMHLGVMKALDEAGIKADIVTGTSVGSIAAVLYSSKEYDEIEQIMYSFAEHEIADFNVSKQGLIKGRALAKWLNKQISYDDVADLPIPTGIVATNLTTKRSVMFTHGDVGRAVQTSSSVPGVFVPVQNNNDILVDGGVLSPVPVYAARQMKADIVIGIDVFCSQPPPLTDSAAKVIANTYWLQSCDASRKETNSADIIVRPTPWDDSLVNFGNRQEREAAMSAGYDAMLPHIPQLKALLNKSENAGPIVIKSDVI